MTQQGDVLLFNTVDGGEIVVENGITQMSSGLDTAAYLSLFGGNADDPGGDDKRLEFWGNKIETEEANRYRSETQYLLNTLSATSANLLRIQQAAERDLAWLLSSKVASGVSVSVTIPALNRIRIVVTIEAQGQESAFAFSENWKASTQ